MKKMLETDFAHWNGQQRYQRLSGEYKQYQAQKVHALAEQREFGNYQALLT